MKKETRTCVGCNKKSNKEDFLRINFNINDKDVDIDLYHNKNFRSYYLCRNKACIRKSFKKRSFYEKFSGAINPINIEGYLKSLGKNEYDINKLLDKEILQAYLTSKIKNVLENLIEYSFNKYSIKDFESIDNKCFRNCYLIIYSDDFDFSKLSEKPELKDILNDKKTIKISNEFVSCSNKISIIYDRKLANCIIENESLIVDFDGLL